MYLTAVLLQEDKFNAIVSNAFNSNVCCCDNIYLNALLAFSLMNHELKQMYLDDESGEDFYIARRTQLNGAVQEIYSYFPQSLSEVDAATDDIIRIDEFKNALKKISIAETTLGKSECWCKIVKTHLALEYTEDVNPDINNILSDSNKQIIENYLL